METFQMAQEVMTKRIRNNYKGQRTNYSIFSQCIFCKDCGNMGIFHISCHLTDFLLQNHFQLSLLLTKGSIQFFPKFILLLFPCVPFIQRVLPMPLIFWIRSLQGRN